MASEDIDTHAATELVKGMNERINSSSLDDKAVREALIDDAQALIATLETTFEHVSRVTWSEPAGSTATVVAADLGIFDQLSKLRPGQSMSSSELAAPSKADPTLVLRVMKHLASRHVIREDRPDAFSSTRLSRALTDRRATDGIHACRETAGYAFLEIPQFLADSGYRNPVGVSPGPFEHAHKLPSDKNVYMWLQQDVPLVGKAFMNYMSGHTIGVPFWIEDGFYPVKERLDDPSLSDEQAVLLVDVGGGQGHDLGRFSSRYSQIPGRLILEDLDGPVEQAKKAGLDSRIEVIRHDFFTPQPVHGARAYFMHHCAHNWDDDRCRAIFKQLKNAMKPGYSKLLLFEYVVPDVRASWKMTSLDWLMMANCATLERTETQWRTLLGSAGLKIEGIWTSDPTTESLIEAVVDS